jgi:hypothetical protein
MEALEDLASDGDWEDNSFMGRSPGQIIMTVSIDERLVEQVDKARGYKPRALFVREALVERLRELGYEVADEIAAPPDRAGKPRAPRKKPIRGIGLNETPVKYRPS